MMSRFGTIRKRKEVTNMSFTLYKDVAHCTSRFQNKHFAVGTQFSPQGLSPQKRGLRQHSSSDVFTFNVAMCARVAQLLQISREHHLDNYIL
mmetsp:Transcript_7733/g.10606  ORF Transcript_7733/g.10606 Transcript_7733/m.10606 type:complete len:92 (-) Transcript_7733:677-952(-)